MRKGLFTASLLVLSSVCFSAPLVTITCQMPKGIGQDYGPTMWARIQADTAHKPPPSKDSFGTHDAQLGVAETFIIDSNKKRVTRLWVDSLEDKKLREEAKTHGIPRPRRRRQPSSLLSVTCRRSSLQLRVNRSHSPCIRSTPRSG
jgi:hypothetical protein